jgi:hypothetical protein
MTMYAPRSCPGCGAATVIVPELRRWNCTERCRYGRGRRMTFPDPGESWEAVSVPVEAP